MKGLKGIRRNFATGKLSLWESFFYFLKELLRSSLFHGSEACSRDLILLSVVETCGKLCLYPAKSIHQLLKDLTLQYSSYLLLLNFITVVGFLFVSVECFSGLSSVMNNQIAYFLSVWLREWIMFFSLNMKCVHMVLSSSSAETDLQCL